MLLCLLLACLSLAAQQAAEPAQQLAVYSVSGMVVNSLSNQPIPDAEVLLAPQFRGAETQMIQSDSAGRFTFIGVVPGRYTLRAQRHGFAPQNYMQHAQFFSAVVVGPDFDTSNLPLALVPQGTITGHVYGSDGEPIRNAQVSLLAHEPSTTGEPQFRGGTSTDDEGRYRISKLMPGTYYVGITAQPWYARHAQPVIQGMQTDSDGSNPRFISQPNPNPGSPDPRLDVTYPPTFFGNANELANARPITLGAGEVETADLVLTAQPSRHLIVNMALPPNEFPNFMARGEMPGIFGQGSVSASQIAPGVWELSGISPGASELEVRTFGVANNRIGNRQRDQHLQTIHLGNETQLNLSTPGSGAVVKGMMQGEAGFKPAGSHVSLSGSPTSATVSADVSADGSFEFSAPLDPGEYSLTVNADSPHFLTHLAATGAKVSGRRIEIGSTDVQLTVTISAANAQISGYATRDGKHVAGMLVALLPETPDRDVAPVRFDQSDGDGSFRFQNVVPGQYKLVALDGAWSAPDWNSEAFAKKFAPQGKSVSVIASGEAKIDLPVVSVNATAPAPAAPHHTFR